jgi:hypothetical protein
MIPGASKMIEQMVDGEAAEQLIEQHVALERRQLESAYRLADAAGVDRPDGLPDPKQRKQALQALLSAVVGGDFAAWYAGELTAEIVATDRNIPERWVGMGTESDEWAEQIAEWAESIKRQAGDVAATDRELASIATNELYGADLETIESEVVGINRSSEIARLVVGNVEMARSIVERVADDLESPEATE